MLMDHMLMLLPELCMLLFLSENVDSGGSFVDTAAQTMLLNETVDIGGS